MRLKERNVAPVRGWYFEYQDDKGVPYTVRSSDGGLTGLIRKVEQQMANNHQPVPEYLAQIIEDQICSRQPADRCWKQSGDKLASGILTVATGVDKAASLLGFTPNLAKKAKGCSACNKRKQRMNKTLG